MRAFIPIIVVCAAISAPLTACVSSPWKVDESKLRWEEKTIAIGYEAAYRNVFEVVRDCDEVWAEGTLYHDIEEGALNLYARHPVFGNKMPFPVGRITFNTEKSGGTLVRAGFMRARDGDIYLSGKREQGFQQRWALDAADGARLCMNGEKAAETQTATRTK